MLNNIFSGSRTAKIARRMRDRCRSFEDRIEELYGKSFLYNLIKKARGTIKKDAKEGFLARVTSDRETGSPILSGSIIVKKIVLFCGTKKSQATGYLRQSDIVSLPRRITSDISTNPLRAVVIIGVVAIITNTMMMALLGNKVSILGWVARFTLILLGTVIIYSGFNWKDIKDAGIFVKLFGRFFHRSKKHVL